jgi:hypothetical protein
MAGLQCPKFVWHRVHKPESLLVEESDAPPVLAIGQDVGILAQSLFPDGATIDSFLPIRERIAATSRALINKTPIYEAAISAGDLYAQVDILVPVRGGWDLVEVKSTTEIKEHFIKDVAFQKYVCDKAGLKVRHCRVATLNKDYVKKCPIKVPKLFVIHSVDAEVKEAIREVPPDISRIRKVLAGKCPQVGIGPHCSDPINCPFSEQCWAFLPANNVFELSRIGGKAVNLLEDGITRITDIPEDFRLTKYQTIQIRSTKSRKPHIDVDAVVEFLSQIEYPIRFFDFETFSTPVPIFDGTKPYQQIPFQYSMHVLSAPNVKPAHYSYLAEGRNDPRPELLRSLKAIIGRSGTILAFNMAFEKARLQEMAVAFPSHKAWIHAALKRINDLIIPFRKAAYYHPRQHGSNSLKQVMPALTNLSYDNLPISDGATAGQEFMRVTYGHVSKEEEKRVRSHLLRYCGQDTGGMIDILHNLRSNAGLTRTGRTKD